MEFEYILIGTQCLTANFEVATGKVIAPSITATRTEEDFAFHIQQTVNSDPHGVWIFISDQLNTHKSESRVRWVTAKCGLDLDLGIKGESGILKSAAKEATFLTDPSHRIRERLYPKTYIMA